MQSRCTVKTARLSYLVCLYNCLIKVADFSQCEESGYNCVKPQSKPRQAQLVPLTPHSHRRPSLSDAHFLRTLDNVTFEPHDIPRSPESTVYQGGETKSNISQFLCSLFLPVSNVSSNSHLTWLVLLL